MDYIKNRQSIRDFTDEKVKDEDLNLILEMALRSPTYLNSQIISLIVLKNKDNINKFAELSGNQAHIKKANIIIITIIDYNRVNNILNNKEIPFLNSIESVIVGSHDAGIMITEIQTVANYLNYGTTIIGGLRLNSDKIIEMLNLPKYTFPLLAITIGKPTISAIQKPLKPRINKNGLVFKEKYDDKLAREYILKYNDELLEYYNSNNLSYSRDYNNLMKAFLLNESDDNTLEILKKQGFMIKE